MKFKAKIQQDKLKILSGVIGCLQKNTSNSQDTCIVYMTPEKVSLAVPVLYNDEVKTFADLNQAVLFSEYRIDSLSDNCILFELCLTLLQRALTSGKGAPVLQLKLAKRQGQPCLCVETRALEMDVVHDIPIKVMRAEEINNYLPPEVPMPVVQLELPRNRSIRQVVDRLKLIEKYLNIDAGMDGQLVLRVETSDSTVKTYYNNLTPRFEAMPSEAASKNNKTSVCVEGRKLASVLHLYGTVSPERCILCIVEDTSVVFHTFLQPPDCGTMTHYLPIVHSVDDS